MLGIGHFFLLVCFTIPLTEKNGPWMYLLHDLPFPSTIN